MQWFYQRDGQPTGPLSEEQMFALVQGGSLSADTLVWRSGTSVWRRADAVFRDAFPPPDDLEDAPPLDSEYAEFLSGADAADSVSFSSGGSSGGDELLSEVTEADVVDFSSDLGEGQTLPTPPSAIIRQRKQTGPGALCAECSRLYAPQELVQQDGRALCPECRAQADRPDEPAAETAPAAPIPSPPESRFGTFLALGLAGVVAAVCAWGLVAEANRWIMPVAPLAPAAFLFLGLAGGAVDSAYGRLILWSLLVMWAAAVTAILPAVAVSGFVLMLACVVLLCAFLTLDVSSRMAIGTGIVLSLVGGAMLYTFYRHTPENRFPFVVLYFVPVTACVACATGAWSAGASLMIPLGGASLYVAAALLMRHFLTGNPAPVAVPALFALSAGMFLRSVDTEVPVPGMRGRFPFRAVRPVLEDGQWPVFGVNLVLIALAAVILARRTGSEPYLFVHAVMLSMLVLLGINERGRFRDALSWLMTAWGALVLIGRTLTAGGGKPLHAYTIFEFSKEYHVFRFGQITALLGGAVALVLARRLTMSLFRNEARAWQIGVALFLVVVGAAACLQITLFLLMFAHPALVPPGGRLPVAPDLLFAAVGSAAALLGLHLRDRWY